MQLNFDVTIIGAGLVGSSLALGLGALGVNVALIDSNPTVPPHSTGWDSRIYALSPGSVSFLQSLGVWSYCEKSRMASVQRMRLFGDSASDPLEFDAYEAGLSELAVIIEHQALARILAERIQLKPHIQCFCPVKPQSWAVNGAHNELQLEDGRVIHSHLLIGADGSSSWVRNQAKIKTSQSVYKQSAVIINFSCERAHEQCAFQWFNAPGILALLPLPGDRVSMVWSTDHVHANELMQGSSQDLAHQVHQATQGLLGTFQRLSDPQIFPLYWRQAAQWVQPQLALVGDAAHSVHPLAGQGVNLGFRDAHSLLRVVSERVSGESIGDYRLLRRYERARKEDALSLRVVTDGLQKLFATENSWMARARNFGLRTLQGQRQIKKLLIHHAVI
jgi:hypothetical protein